MPADVGRRPILNKGNKRVFVKPPSAFPGPRYVKDKWDKDGRYAYRYQVEQWRKTGKVADPKREVIAHGTERDPGKFTPGYDKDVQIESRKKHYARDRWAGRGLNRGRRM